MSRLQLNVNFTGEILRHSASAQTEIAIEEQNGGPLTPAERPWKCFVCFRVNRNNICMTCKASYNYCPRIESLVVRKMLRHHTERQNETKKPWECGCCKRTNRGDLEKCRICGAHNITFRKAESSWWCWDKSMENAGYVRDEREGLQDGRHAVIQAELQGRVDEAQRREDERLQAIAEAGSEVVCNKSDDERRINDDSTDVKEHHVDKERGADVDVSPDDGIVPVKTVPAEPFHASL